MQYGDIIGLGRHRLMYGDATSARDVAALTGDREIDLVLTDPPYGVRSVSPKTGQIGSASQIYAPVIGDTDTSMFRDAWRILRTVSSYHIIWGGQNFTDFLPPSSGWIFWDKCKGSPNLSFGDGELAWCNFGTKIKKYDFRWNGAGRDGDKNLNLKVHPNQKPVELHMDIINDFTRPGAVILDCFGGSGTTLIAAEMTGRTCLMMEISPHYIQTIIDRYTKLTEGMINYED